MSNKIKKDIVEYVASLDFIKKVSQEGFPENTYNALLMAHMMCVAYKTTGIRDMGFTFSYQGKLGDDVLIPRMGFYLYTTKNSLVEETNRCSNSGGRFSNIYFHATSTRKLRDNFVEYFQSIAKNIPETYSSERDLIKLHEMRANFRTMGSKKDERNLSEFYVSMIGYHPFIKSCIEKIYLNNNLSIKDSIKIIKNKI